MEQNFTNYANTQMQNKYSSQSIQAINSNINVVINNQSGIQNSKININNNILVIQNFSKENNNNDANKKESCYFPSQDQSQMSSPKKRIDRKGNEIKQSGKHSVVFIDKISKVRLADVVEIESYKEFNQTEPIPSSNSQKNSCCSIF